MWKLKELEKEREDKTKQILLQWYNLPNDFKNN